ncbi:MAG: integrase family protein [Herbinix sp.]|jgi:integrase|nr:integrase family protein [Herbinix sp.]
MVKRSTRQVENLPKGITYRKNEDRYLGRLTYKGEAYYIYDTNVGRLERALDKLRQDLKEGKEVNKAGKEIKKEEQTLNDWFDYYLKTFKKKKLKIGTYSNYSNHYNYYVREGIGKKKLKEVSVDDIQELFNSLDDRGFSKGMIKLVSATLNGCLVKAMKKRMIEFNPVEYTELPEGKEKKKSVALTKGIQNVFQEYSKESYLFSLFKVALMTGMRRGELQGICWKDIDFERRKIYVNHTLIWIEGQGYYLDRPKTKASLRELPMNTDLYNYMQSIKKQADEKGLGKQDDYIFCLPDGAPISRYRISNELNMIQNKMRNAGFECPIFTCHSLRHTYATRAIENGINPQNLKDLLGHSSLAITMDLYGHVMEDVKISEVEKLNGVF